MTPSLYPVGGFWALRICFGSFVSGFFAFVEDSQSWCYLLLGSVTVLSNACRIPSSGISSLSSGRPGLLRENGATHDLVTRGRGCQAALLCGPLHLKPPGRWGDGGGGPHRALVILEGKSGVSEGRRRCAPLPGPADVYAADLSSRS